MNIKFLPYGNRAILINFEQKISSAINHQVTWLATQIEAARFAGIEFCIPAYCSLTVGFDLKKTDYLSVVKIIKQLISKYKDNFKQEIPKKEIAPIVKIPVCYHEDFAPDLIEVSKQTGLSIAKIITLHTAQTYHVFMLGFLPGFPYLGVLPKELSVKRKATPRLKVPARSVGLAGLQTGIYPSDAPGGWQIIGQTPLAVFIEKADNPFLLKAGDQVQFHAISKEEFLVSLESGLVQNTL
ncbi:MAG: inhibitor of KinA [Paraglaciecola sp.]|jgi:inhibitor of KinA